MLHFLGTGGKTQVQLSSENVCFCPLAAMFKGPMACCFMDAFIQVLVGLIQHLKTFKKFSLGAELQPLRASPTMSFTLTGPFLGWLYTTTLPSETDKIFYQMCL